MVEELHDLFARSEAQPEEVRRRIAELVHSELERAQQDAAHTADAPRSYAGAWSDLPEDDEAAAIERARHAAPPTAPMDEHLRWLDEV